MSELINRIQRIIKVKRWAWKKNNVTEYYVNPIFGLLVLIGLFAGLLYAGWWSVSILSVTPDVMAIPTTSNSTSIEDAVSMIATVVKSMMPLFLVMFFIIVVISIKQSLCCDGWVRYRD